MKRFGTLCGQNGGTDKEEIRAKRLVTFMGLIGPMMLVGLLLWIVHWDASTSTQTARQEYFPSHYVNAATAVEDHVQAF
ncbi:MAG TPA: hypothetical protein VFB75_20675 [Burkholderiales bacterium]|nr:hypothetical protein [Burkholderiales bacterium]